MTTRSRRSRVQREQQDLVKRAAYGVVEDVPGAGMMMSVRGTGFVDYELPIMNMGYGFRLPSNSNAEVVTFSLGSDVSDKVAMPLLPRDLQYQWPEGTGGFQNPTNPEARVEFDDQGVWLKEGTVFLGDNRELQISLSNGQITITAAGSSIDFVCDSLTHNGTNIGEDHVHGGVRRGTSNTDGPE